MITSNKIYIPVRASNRNSIIVFLLLFTLYIVDNSPITSLVDGILYTYVFIPILWLALGLVVWKIPHIKSTAKLKNKKFINFWAFYFGLLYVVLTVFVGLFIGLGKSPYGHSFQAIIINIIFVGAPLIGREFVRSYLVNSLCKKENYLIFILVALVMTLVNFSFNKYTNISNLQSFVKFMAEYFGPEFSHNLFVSYLVYLGGPLPSIIYIGVIQGFHWLSPILPNLSWIVSALIGILVPIFFMMFFKVIYLSKSKEISGRKSNEEGIFSWIVTCVVSILIIWFAVGVFPIYPSVIATGSMEPMIKPGDIILVKKVTTIDDIDNLKVNDVIQFRRDNILISHRIIQILNDEKEGLLFETKGDNNSSPDSELVKAQDIKGTIKYTIPKLGLLTLLIKSNYDVNLEDIIF